MIPESVLLVGSVTVSFGTCLKIESSHDIDRAHCQFKRGNRDCENTYRGTRKLESRVSRVFVIPGKSWEKPRASVANAAKAPCEMIPCG